MSYFISHCHHCGTRYQDGVWNGHTWPCHVCGHIRYLNPAVGTNAIIRREDGEYLFVVRGRDPWKGLLDFPGGFVDKGEALEEALTRELMEEIGIIPKTLTYFCSDENQYTYKNFTFPTVDIHFMVTMSDDQNPHPSDDAQEIVWKRLDDISASELAGPTIALVVERLRNAEWRA